MTIQLNNINVLWGSLIVDELIRNDINFFFLSPGSRSTPLTVAVARHPQAKNRVVYDERSAAFMALGYARGCGKPAVLICTSGTAIANYMPAVVEAASDYVPLIVISADRPAEKIESGANQTIRQHKFFGDYARWSFELPSPTEEIDPEVVLTTVDHLIHQAVSAPRGPVHLNCHFREPLAPVSREISPGYSGKLHRWELAKKPYTTYTPAIKTLSESDRNQLVNQLNNTQQGLLVAGRLKTPQDVQAVRKLSEHLKWPVFADILSGLRLGFQQKNLIPYFDLMLLAEELHPKLRPETVVHIGEQPASKRYLQFIENVLPAEYILIAAHSYRSDPVHRVTRRFSLDIPAVCEELINEAVPTVSPGWIEKFHNYSSTIEKILGAELSESQVVSEPAVSRILSQLTPASHALFLANSLPIREMDMFGDPMTESFSVASNRGVSGIDGTISTALGYALAANKKVTLLTGDLAFIHDLNSLSHLSTAEQSMIIVLINNGGGGIFSFLPIAEHTDVFEKYFGTPHSFTFEKIAGQFSLEYAAPRTLREFSADYKSFLQKNRPALIEVKTDRQENHDLHLRLYHKIITALEKSDKQ